MHPPHPATATAQTDRENPPSCVEQGAPVWLPPADLMGDNTQRRNLAELLTSLGLEHRARLLSNQRVTLKKLRSGVITTKTLRQMGLASAETTLLLAAANGTIAPGTGSSAAVATFHPSRREAWPVIRSPGRSISGAPMAAHWISQASKEKPSKAVQLSDDPSAAFEATAGRAMTPGGPNPNCSAAALRGAASFATPGASLAASALASMSVHPPHLPHRCHPPRIDPELTPN